VEAVEVGARGAAVAAGEATPCAPASMDSCEGAVVGAGLEAARPVAVPINAHETASPTNTTHAQEDSFCDMRVLLQQLAKCGKRSPLSLAPFVWIVDAYGFARTKGCLESYRTRWKMLGFNPRIQTARLFESGYELGIAQAANKMKEVSYRTRP